MSKNKNKNKKVMNLYPCIWTPSWSSECRSRRSLETVWRTHSWIQIIRLLFLDANHFTIHFWILIIHLFVPGYTSFNYSFLETNHQLFVPPDIRPFSNLLSVYVFIHSCKEENEFKFSKVNSGVQMELRINIFPKIFSWIWMLHVN